MARQDSLLAALLIDALLLLGLPVLPLHAEKGILVLLLHNIRLSVRILHSVSTVLHLSHSPVFILSGDSCMRAERSDGAWSRQRYGFSLRLNTSFTIPAVLRSKSWEVGAGGCAFVPPPHLRTAVGATDRAAVLKDKTLSL